MQYKLRVLVNKKNVVGITIPNDVAVFFKETYFNIERSGTCIILHSGCNLNPTQEQVVNFTF